MSDFAIFWTAQYKVFDLKICTTVDHNIVYM
jgi:hypothetical protein